MNGKCITGPKFLSHSPISSRIASSCLSLPCGLSAAAVRQWFAIFVLAIMLVSHGGFSGALPHVEHDHSHEAGSSHHAPEPVEATQETNLLIADNSTSGETVPHGSAHSHITVGLPETASLIASYRSERSLPQPSQTEALTGSEPAPLTQPPLA